VVLFFRPFWIRYRSGPLFCVKHSVNAHCWTQCVVERWL